MALSDDQRAMLRLLAQREQGYDDIAALMGLSVDEVRARVKDALAQLEREGEEVPLSEQPEEEPTPEPEAVAPPPPPPPPPPAAPEPEPAAPQPAAAPPPDAAVPKPSERPRLGLPKQPGARAAIAAGAAVLVAIVVILIVAGGGDGGGDSTSAAAGADTTTGSTTTGTTTTANGQQTEPTEAILEPVGDSGASGRAIFGNLEERLALLVEAEGLEPSGSGQTYVIWLAESPRRMVPVGEIPVGSDGTISTQVPLPTELLAFIANETFRQVTITLANASRFEKSVEKAAEDEDAPAYTGKAVLRGTVTGPIVGAELPAGEAEAEGEGESESGAAE